MPQLNFFKVFPHKRDDLVRLLEKRLIIHTDSRELQHDGVTFELNLFFSSAPSKKPVKWIPQLRRIFKVPTKDRYNYSAVVLIEFSGHIYAICYGVSHHFVSSFSDWEFGINVAEKLFEKHMVKNTREFGGLTSRSIVTYSQATDVPFEPGESVHFLKGEPRDTKAWGKIVSCGQSVRLSDRSFSLENAHELALQLETLESQGKKISRIPKSHKVKSAEIIAQLNDDLILNMKERNYMVSISDQQLSGVEFIFADRYTYHLKVGRGEIELDRTVSLDEISQIVSEYFDNDYGRLLKANVEAREDDDRSFTQKMIKFIDYVDSQNNYYLQEGAWFEFDQNYLSLITAAVDQIELTEDNEFPRFDEEEYVSWLQEMEFDRATWYRERYFNERLERECNYRNFDRTMFPVDGLKIEFADAIKDGDFVHVKFGNPQNMAYLIDQSIASLNVLKRRNFTLETDTGPEKVETLTLWMFLKRKTDIHRISELRSLIFLMKLANWQREVTKSGLTPKLKVSYY